MTDVYRDIEAQIPRLRRYAHGLVRDAAAAEDLVQECLARALAKLHLWQEGTNLRAWLFTILHNQYVNDVRRSVRAGTPVELGEAEPQLRQGADQERCLELRDLARALARLPEAQRAPILLVAIDGLSYAAAGARLGIPVGTVRSRISRGRGNLGHMMGTGVHQPAAPARPPVPCPARSRDPGDPGQRGRTFVKQLS